MPGPESNVDERLVRVALEQRRRAYAPYSRFRVGAALLSSEGDIIGGCNVENASFSLTICAERAAASAAIAAGRRQWSAMVVASPGGVTPCGACRQFLAEFAPNLELVCVDVNTEQRRSYLLPQLLPFSFDSSSLPPSPR